MCPKPLNFNPMLHGRDPLEIRKTGQLQTDIAGSLGTPLAPLAPALKRF
jgi:hypothetical protein